MIGDSNNNWVSARPIWNQHAYRITNIDDDGSVPVVEVPNWPNYNSFRQGGFGSIDPLDASDILVESIDACADGCPAEFTWLIRPYNQGVFDLPAGVPVSIYAEDAAGTRTLLQTLETTSAMLAGETAETLEVIVAPSGLPSAVKLVAVGDDWGDLTYEFNECEEGNNEVELLLPVCP